MSRLDIRSRLALATLPAATVVLLDELVLWAGRPAGDPTARMVADSYQTRAAQELLGDALWLAALGVLVSVLWTAAARFPPLPRWIVRTVRVWLRRQRSQCPASWGPGSRWACRATR